MESVREPPWADYEKAYLLAEILKAAPISPHVLLNVIRDAQIQPRWNDIALPPGRSLRSCQMAYDSLSGTYSGSDYRRQPIPVTGALPIQYAGPEASKKRPYPEAAAPIGRPLQPRPPQAYPGEYIQAGGPVYVPTVPQTGEPANKKKRGRPTKAEAQQRAQEAAARGEPYPPPRRGRASVTAPPEPLPLGSEPPPHERTPPQAALGTLGPAMTPQHQMQPEQGSESSSGKRRRTKPPNLELGKQQQSMVEMESPLAYSGSGDASRSQAYSSFTPISAPLPSSTDSRDRDIRMEGVEETQPRTTTPHSFKDTVGI